MAKKLTLQILLRLKPSTQTLKYYFYNINTMHNNLKAEAYSEFRRKIWTVVTEGGRWGFEQNKIPTSSCWKSEKAKNRNKQKKTKKQNSNPKACRHSQNLDDT